MSSYADLRGLASGKPEFVAAWQRVCDSLESERQRWIANLRTIRVAGARADDGWVNRERREVHFDSYPDFDDGLFVGAEIALGRPDKFRLVRLTAKRESMFGMTWWAYEPAA